MSSASPRSQRSVSPRRARAPGGGPDSGAAPGPAGPRGALPRSAGTPAEGRPGGRVEPEAAGRVAVELEPRVHPPERVVGRDANGPRRPAHDGERPALASLRGRDGSLRGK